MFSPGPDLCRRRLLLAGAAALALPGLARAADLRLDWTARPLQLVMITTPGCYYCRMWRKEIGPGFAASPAGHVAPLVEVDLAGPFPDGLVFSRRPRLTPSFILMDHGTEIGRVEGYVGARHFYPVLEDMMRRAGLILPATLP